MGNVRVVHASDWHWGFQQCPEADLYVFTGDMLPNHRIKDRDKGSYTYGQYTTDPEHERLYQAQDIREFLFKGGMRRFLASPDAPIVCVRGNHDFVDLAPMFEGCNFRHEFVDNEVIGVDCGGTMLSVTGHRGIPWINGRWSDETPRPELLERVRAMTCEGVDLVLTHYSAMGVLDKAGSHLGLEGMASALGNRILPGGAHCFGHIHECGGRVEQLGDIWFSNAATSVNILEIER